MSDGPITRDDIAKLADIAQDDNRFKIEMLLYIQESRHWRRNHEAEDDRRYLEMKSAINSQSGVVSSINEDRTEIKGMRRLIVGVVAVIGTIGAAVIGVIEIVKALGDKS